MRSVKFAKISALGCRQSTRQGVRWQRLADIAIASFLLVLILPLVLFVAAAIVCESSGPILERSIRAERKDKQLTLLTFRTTKSYADSYPSHRRVTSVGRLLRYTRIDALPELINVLLGDIRITEVGVFGRTPPRGTDVHRQWVHAVPDDE
jgi:lipopolysaccharide/colanic/teichoic acid biosynthesis glycosyltransferase